VTAGDQFVGAPGIAAETGLKVDREDAARPLGRIGHGLGFVGVHGHGFFAEDVLARIKRRDGGLGVGDGRAANHFWATSPNVTSATMMMMKTKTLIAVLDATGTARVRPPSAKRIYETDRTGVSPQTAAQTAGGGP